MALVIRVSKSDVAKVQALNNLITHLYESVVEAGDDHLFTPVSGKLIAMLKILCQHDVPYTLHVAQSKTEQN
jgi:hypothetical protein